MKYYRKHLPTGQVWEVPFDGTKTQLVEAVNEYNRISNSGDKTLWTYWF